MATPIRWIVYDVLEDLKQVFDNRQIGVNQVLYWVTIVANRLKKQHIDKLINKNQWIPGKFLNIFTGIPITVSPVSSNPNIVAQRKYIKLPASVMDLEFENGVEYMTYDIGSTGCCNEPPFTMVNFTPTTPGGASILYGDPYTTPSPKNPYFYRVQDYLYTLGLECVEVKDIEIGLYTYADPHMICDINSSLDFPEHLLTVLRHQVLDMGVYALKVPQSRQNIGGDEQKVPITLKQGTQQNPATTDTTTDDTTTEDTE
jgi:hypothetical protein